MVTALRLLTTHSSPASSRLQVGDVQDNYITCLNDQPPAHLRTLIALPRCKKCLYMAESHLDAGDKPLVVMKNTRAKRKQVIESSPADYTLSSISDAWHLSSK